ncbi:hypothetical protein [Rubrolithibacter danxiaensis]|uniref:hypothetical protein n=1 Tax=Rubrolithibacter danxiaensis TaxID=3390805 RepID=UPI003BF8B62B
MNKRHFLQYGKLSVKTVALIVILQIISIKFTAAQTDNLNSIQSKFEKYSGQHLLEKIFVHTDKNSYMAGEIIWFKLYSVDGTIHKPLDLSKVAYVEVLDKAMKPVLQAKVSMSDGSGNGSFQIPLTLTTGNFKFRAYTSWMKNYSADFYFEKVLTIINPLKESEISNSLKNRYDIQFFPEGGNLVKGLRSKVAFRVVSQNGKGSDFRGAVVDEKNDTVARFQPLKFGIGSFYFTPAANHQYKAVLKFNSEYSVVKDLPAIQNEGFVMSMAQENSSQLSIAVNATSKNSDEIYLFAHSRQRTKQALAGRLNNGLVKFIVDINKLDEGISHFTIFNSANQPLCERLYFKRPTKKLIITGKSDKPLYGIRKNISLNILTNTDSAKEIAADLSVSVYKSDDLQPIEEKDIQSYIWLTSDLRGSVESPNYYFENNTPEANEALDNLMLSQGWRRFNWNKVLSSNKPNIEFLPEYQGHLITGKVTAASGPEAGDVLTFLSIPGKRIQLYVSKSDQNGKVKFTAKDLYGTNELIVQSDFRKDSTYRFHINNPFSEKISSATIPDFQLNTASQNALLEHSVGMQVQTIFSGDKLTKLYTPPTDSSSFYKAEKVYLLDDYTRFPTMEEVLREYVPEVSVFKQQKKFYYKIPYTNKKGFVPGEPLVMLDGTPVFDIDKLMAFDPTKIRKLEVVGEKYFYGPLTAAGIASFSTYGGDMANYELDPKALVVDYEGLQLKREFYSPVYDSNEQIQDRTPDFRNVLYWSPDVKTDDKGKHQLSFYSSDLPGKFFVVIQGISKDGHAGSKTISFEVTKPL